MDIEIRPMRHADCAVVAERLKEFGNDEGENRKRLGAQERGEGLLLIAWSGGAPVGRLWIRWAGCQEIPRIRETHPAAAAVGECPAFNEIEVVERLRGKGIGSRLIGCAEGLARERGYRRVSLTALADGRPRKLYERLGYADPGIGVFHTFGTYTDGDGRQVPWDNGRQVFLVKDL